jgi:FKBP-type peptidyl-prolyl cis-trans isomerase
MKNANSKIALHYKATYINGEVIHSTYKNNNPLIFQVNDSLVWPCLAESVKYMKKGGKSICVASSNLAGGQYGDALIPPCKSIIFEMEVVEVK